MKNKIDSAPYDKAQEVWDERIGTAKSQARHWCIACFGSILISILLLVVLVAVVSQDKTYVYVAKVQPGQTVANLEPIGVPVAPTDPERLFFLSQFIQNITAIPLDPVLLRHNWLTAYSMVAGNAENQLTAYAASADPFVEVGNYTQTVSIQNFHPVGHHTYTLTWSVVRYTVNGQVDSEHVYNGSFTLMQTAPPQNLPDMLANPFGLRVVYFNISKQG